MAGGRPPMYDASNQLDIDKVDSLCISYFETLTDNEPPTVTGLTLHLGFCDKSSTYDYAKIPQFTHSIKRAITKIEQYHEKQAAYGDKCTGNIFVLKNFGWKDNQGIEHSGEVKGNSPTIVFKKYTEDGD